MIAHDDSIFRTEKGGEVVWSFEMPCEQEWGAQMIASALQDHGQSGSNPYIHTTQATSSAALARPNFGSPSS